MTKKNIPQLNPSEEINAEFTACMTNPGVFNLFDPLIGVKLLMFENPDTKGKIETYEERKAHPNAKPLYLYLSGSTLLVNIKQA